MPDDEREQQPSELLTKLPKDLHPLLDRRDGPAALLAILPQIFHPPAIAYEGDAQRAWELTGLHFLHQRRIHEALAIFSALYDHMLTAQMESSQRCNKGMPLVWMSECYSVLRFPVHAKRYLMLTLVEDAIATDGKIPPECMVDPFVKTTSRRK
jgi:hypothetical protein